MDVEKQKQLAEIKQSMIEDNIDIKELYLEKQKLFDALIEQRTILSRRKINTRRTLESEKNKAVDLVQDTIMKFIKYDRLDAFERIKPSLTPNQIAWAEQAITDHQNQLREQKMHLEGSAAQDAAENSEQGKNLPPETESTKS